MADWNFPTNPEVGDVYPFGGKEWKWNGTAWDLIPLADSILESITEAIETSDTALQVAQQALEIAEQGSLGVIKRPPGGVPVIATQGQTTFDVDGGFNFLQGFVYLNGVKISAPDVDLSNGDQIIFVNPLSQGDEVDWMFFGVFLSAEATPASGSVTDDKVSTVAGINANKLEIVAPGVRGRRRLVDGELLRNGVSPYIYGAPGNDTVDDSQAFEDAALLCRQRGYPLNLRGGKWALSKAVDLSYVTTILADRYSTIRDFRGVGTPSNEYLFTIGDPNQSGSLDGRSDGLVLDGQLHLVCVDNRAVQRRGIFLKGGQMSIEQIYASGYNGTAIHLHAIWDSTFVRLVTELSGNSGNFAILGDSTDQGDLNCLKIMAMQCEQSVDKGISLSVIRSEIGNIHAEKLRVTNTNDGANLPNGLQYINHYFNLSNSKVGQSIFQNMPVGNVVPGTNETTISNRMNIVVSGDFSDVNTWACGDEESDVDIMVVGGRAGSFKTIGCNSFYQASPANTVDLENIHVADTIRLGAGATFKNISCDKFDAELNANNINGVGLSTRIFEFTSGGIRGNINISGVTCDAVGNVYAPQAGYTPVTLSKVNINSVYGAFDSRIDIIDGLVKATPMASQAPIFFKNITFQNFSGGTNASYLTQDCIVLGNATNWSVPTNYAWPKGTKTGRVGYLAGGVELAVNTDSAINWAPRITAP